jgi:hypothetical protein
MTHKLPPEAGTVEMVLKLAMHKVLDEFDNAMEFQDRMIDSFGLSEDEAERTAELNVIYSLSKARAQFVEYCQDNNVREAMAVYKRVFLNTNHE